MQKTTLNDVSYSFAPLELYEPDPNYQVDREELEKSIHRSQRFIALLHKYKGENKKKEKHTV
ncbi:MAG: hypothetical protein NC307_03730 [Roseburia sp.]|nr:hypothetical protein [Roseburia sp.]